MVVDAVTIKNEAGISVEARPGMVLRFRHAEVDILAPLKKLMPELPHFKLVASVNGFEEYLMPEEVTWTGEMRE